MAAAQSPQAMAILEALYDEHAASVYRYLLGMLGRREDAEDGVQTIWLKLARKGERLAEIRDLGAYLWTAARRYARTAHRRRAAEPEPLDEEGELAMLAPAANPGVPREELCDVERAVAKLPPKLRETIVLVSFGGLTLREASDRLGIPAGTAASRYRLGVEKLRRTLKATFDPPSIPPYDKGGRPRPAQPEVDHDQRA